MAERNAPYQAGAPRFMLVGVRQPAEEYAGRLKARREELERAERRHVAFGNWRLAAAAAAAVMAWLAWARDAISAWWLLAPVAAFVVLFKLHERLQERRRCLDRAAQFYEEGVARLEDRWTDTGESGQRFAEENHPYAEDLDLFGPGSLFQLLCRARTRAGETTLAAWLKAGAPLEQVRERQAAVDELRPLLDLREDLAVLGEKVRSGVHPEALARWGEGRILLQSRALRIAAFLLPLATIAALVCYAAWGWRTLFVAAMLLQTAFGWRLRATVLRVVHAVEEPSHDLRLLAEVLARLEAEQFRSPRLRELRAVLDAAGSPPSQLIARLNRWIELLDSREHLLMRIAGPAVLWTTQLAFVLEAWRKRTGKALRPWLAAVGEMEALSSFASYAYEHPADPFPEFAAESPLFDGEELGHPLLPESRMVRNSVRLGAELRVLIVSGSNMSGKSTLLRTVGTNTVLAMAGAPVRAQRLRLSPLVVGASIRILDSLQSGKSRFYAEIVRLRNLVDLTRGPLPLLFLLDEFLHGTNSHDRRIGAEGIVRGLVDRGAIGLVTTHDLALAHIADSLAPRGTNVHFEDHLEAGKMSFDYRLRPGIVGKSNALELMRSIGLEV